MKFKITGHNIFILSILIKAFDGVVEIIGGLLIIIFQPASVINLIAFLTQSEISEDPRDLVANYLIHSFQNYSVSLQIFWSAYFFIHGAIKVFLVVFLLRRRPWAYPTAIVIFILFFIYQVYRLSINYSPLLIFLSIFDVFVISLTYLEYKNVVKAAVRGKSLS